MGVWNSFQTEKTGARGSGPSNLYETDFYPSLTVGLPGNFETSIIYYAYTSPNGGFDTVQEVDFLIGYDDSDLLGRLAMSPTVTFALETDGTSFGDKRGSFVGLGLEPTIYSSESENFPLSITFPLALGLSIDNYYEEAECARVNRIGMCLGGTNDHFGYLQWGLRVGMDLPFVPETWGTWNVSVTGSGYYLGGSLARWNFDTIPASTEKQQFQGQGVGSLGISY